MNVSINAMLKISGKILADGSIAKDVLDGTITSVCGIQSLQMGVFGGIIVGLGWQHCTIVSTRLSCRMHCHFSVEQDLCLSFQQWHIFCRNLNVFYLAYCAERNLCTRRSGDRNRIFRTLLFGIIKRALIPFDCTMYFTCRSGRQQSVERWRLLDIWLRWTEHLLRTAC